ncbi:unnamed protein product, partial [Gulo gulo]
MAFATCPAVQAPTSWTAPHGGPWAAGGSSWRGPSWVAALSCCTGMPSTAGLTATACTQRRVASCAWSWDCCCATSTATAWSADGASKDRRVPTPLLTCPGPGWPSAQKRGLWTLSDLTPANSWHGFCPGEYLGPHGCPFRSSFPICKRRAVSVWGRRVLGEERLLYPWKCSIKESSSY